MVVEDYLDAAVEDVADLFFDPGDAGQVFGLACSCREAGARDEALRAFRRRAGMGGCPVEVWYSLYQVAVLAEALGHPDPAVVSAYLAAFHHRPSRAEPLVALASYYRISGSRHALAYLFAREAIALAVPCGELFVEDAVYVWRALDEYAVAAYWTERYSESVAAGERLLDCPLLPRAEYARVNINLAAARAALRAHPDTAAEAAGGAASARARVVDLPRQRDADTCPDPIPTA
jgi:hypothetical protein